MQVNLRETTHGWQFLAICLLLSNISGLIGTERANGEDPRAFVDQRTAHRDEIQRDLRDQFSALFAGMSPEAKSGYQNLTQKVYLPADFDETVFRKLDTLEFSWPFLDEKLPLANRTGTWLAHGLAPRPDNSSLPLQYVQSNGQFVMNCFACHGGTLYGATYPGSPNTTYALESFTEVVRKTKLQLGKPLTHMDMGLLVMPLGTTNGTSNAVMFGVALMNFRDADLNFLADKLPAAMTHHDMDAPPWWNFHRKSHLYIDGFAEKGHKGLMQFMLVRQNGPEKFRAWESEFRDVYQFLEELRPPKYPLAIDEPKAKRGQGVFEHHCAECHGTYGDNQAEYPERMIPIDEINTDRVRFDALTPEHRQAYGDSWFADYGKQDTIAHATGYVAPPLDGIWASAPYLHNGSVPTLWHLLHPDKRPAVWRRIAMACDEKQVGLVVEALDQVPKKLSKGEKRWYFDTQVTGKSAAGHDYPNALTETQKDDLLEYLKTL
jgi:mono/diheme cytochrome c family protein